MSKPGANSRSLSSPGAVIQLPQEQQPSELGKRTLQTCDLASILITLIERCHHVTPDLCIRLSATPGAGIEIAAQEAATLDFVVREIVSNAYRYSHPAGSPVEVTMECGVRRNGEIVIDIGDDGVGLPPDFAEWRDAGDGMVSVR
jgi:two-component sensor histidine kinase